MATLNDALETIDYYIKTYRKPNLPQLDISGLYDLFPGEMNKLDVQVSEFWPESYPYGDRKGIYLVLNEQLKLLYVGKASLGSCIGNRLNSYFGYDENKKCKLKHSTWSERPRFLMTIAVPIDLGFEAPALEEFFLTTFTNDLPDNQRGTMK